MNHNNTHLDETIAAVASPPGPATRGIVRLSGSHTVSIVAQCFAPSDSANSSKSTPWLQDGHLLAGESRVRGRMLVWPTSKSFTRQPSAEFHTFGSRPVLEMCLQTFVDAGARLANPGEFTMRAFLSGRIDLVQAEAVLAVIDAQDRKQLDVALDQLAGGLGSRLQATRNELVAALAELEAGLDFVEEDIEFISGEDLLAKLNAAADSIHSVLSQIKLRDSATPEFKVALFGLPNAGKSSLFNRLVGDQAAIVSDTRGTTTDTVSRDVVIEDTQVHLIDTAGLESDRDADTVTAASQQHRQNQLENCDLAIDCIDASEFLSKDHPLIEHLPFGRVGGLPPGRAPQETTSHIKVLTRIDLLNKSQQDNLASSAPANAILTSSQTGQGIESLQRLIHESAIQAQSVESGVVGSTVLRSRSSLVEASDSVGHAISAANQGHGEEIVAAEIRAALDSLGLVVGTIYADDILDVVFGKFCIGK